MKIRHENLKAYLDADRGAASRIAKRLGFKSATVSQWKNGVCPVPPEHNEVICDELGRSLNDLCKPMRDAAGQSAHAPNYGAELIAQLSIEGQREVIKDLILKVEEEKRRAAKK